MVGGLAPQWGGASPLAAGLSPAKLCNTLLSPAKPSAAETRRKLQPFRGGSSAEAPALPRRKLRGRLRGRAAEAPALLLAGLSPEAAEASRPRGGSAAEGAAEGRRKPPAAAVASTGFR